MTPLLQAVLRSYLPGQTPLTEVGGPRPRLDFFDSVVPFDCTAVRDVARTTVAKLAAADDQGNLTGLLDSDLDFLPAPATWVEWKDKTGTRVGVMLNDSAAGRCGRAFFQKSGRPAVFGSAGMLKNLPEGAAIIGEIFDALMTAQGMLVLINLPRVIGRVQHQPHAGLQRELARNKKLIGSFPLNVWTELKLEVRPPKREGDAAHETQLTGEKALEFVRRHLRFQNGKWVWVRWHFRGNPALGIRQRKYTLVDKTRAA
jgi:hypothetical protein